MVQPQTADGDLPQDDLGEVVLKTELHKTRTAIEHLTDEIVSLKRRSYLNWLVTGVVVFLLLFTAGGSAYGYVYIQDLRDRDREEVAEDRIHLEETFRSGCDNAVLQQRNNREELLEFGRYLGARNSLPESEIEAALSDLIARFDEINPPRDCSAEAEARQAERDLSSGGHR